MKNVTVVATGDSFITRRLPRGDESFHSITSVMREADVRLTNLEVTTHDFEGMPNFESGGTWAIAKPDVLGDLKDYGFNLIAWANNHTLDYLHDGLLATEKYLDQYGFVHAGAGSNLAKASAPRYIETANARVSLISVTSSFNPASIAGEQRPDMLGRPGINPLRFNSVYVVTPDQMETLRDIAQKVHINAKRELSIKEGFVVDSEGELFTFGNYVFKMGESPGHETTPDERDMRRILKTVNEAKRQSDYVLVSLHAHEMKGKNKEEPADFLRAFAHRCIDEGAHAVIGHGPHILRGIEIYKNRPIFYSLGNFIFQNETVSHLPADFYEKYGLDHRHNVADALNTRSKNGTIGFAVNENIWQSVIPFWKMEGEEVTEILLYPIELGFKKPRYQRGWPSLSQNSLILEKLQELSKPFGTTITMEGNIGKIVLG